MAETRICKREGCDNEFQAYPSQNKRYCQPECRWESEELRSLMRGSLGVHHISGVDVVARTATCTVCGPTNVRLRRVRNETKTWRCRTAEKAREWARLYKLTVGDVAEMVAVQGNRCAICRRDVSQDPYIDHCHATGRVRGVLCRGCNTAIGSLGDDPERIRAAAAYVEASGWPWDH